MIQLTIQIGWLDSNAWMIHGASACIGHHTGETKALSATLLAVLLYSVFCSYCFVSLTFFFYSWHCVYSL